ncbi:hypothetical protein MTO96_041822 [Rhipicephalus appendiculatus]
MDYCSSYSVVWNALTPWTQGTSSLEASASLFGTQRHPWFHLVSVLSILHVPKTTSSWMDEMVLASTTQRYVPVRRLILCNTGVSVSLPHTQVCCWSFLLTPTP